MSGDDGELGVCSLLQHSFSSYLALSSTADVFSLPIYLIRAGALASYQPSQSETSAAITHCGLPDFFNLTNPRIIFLSSYPPSPDYFYHSSGLIHRK